MNISSREATSFFVFFLSFLKSFHSRNNYQTEKRRSSCPISSTSLWYRIEMSVSTSQWVYVPHRNVSLHVGCTFIESLSPRRSPAWWLWTDDRAVYSPWKARSLWSVIGPLDIHTQKSRLAARSLTTIQSLSLSRSGKFVHVSPVFPNQDRLSCRLHYPRLEPVYPREMRATFLAVVKPIRTGASLGLI